jgi:hypothetical protein
MRFLLIKLNVFIVIFLIGCSAYSQDYERAIKVKGFPGWGVSYKHLTGFERGYELSIHTTDDWDYFSIIRFFQMPAFPKISNQWFFSYGYGTHVSLYRSYSVYNPFTPFDAPRQYNRNFLSPGFDGVLGFEYRMLKNPFLISFDINANFEILGPNYFRINSFNTIGVAYVF